MIEQLIFCYFNIRNFEIPEYPSFCFSLFQILYPTHTNWCQRRMYTMDQSFPNLQTNSITHISLITIFDINGSRKDIQLDTKNRKIL